MKIYCPDCGSPNAYSSKKPNFCQNCGQNFKNAKASGPPPHKQSSPLGIDIEYDEEDGLEITIQGLDVEIEGDMQRKGTPISEVAGTLEPSEKPAKRKKGGRFTKKAKEQFLKDFSKEAGTSRRLGGKT